MSSAALAFWMLGWLLVVGLSAPAASVPVVDSDMNVLLDLNAAWHNATNWIRGNNCGALSGVTCDNRGHVTGLNLSLNSLTGSIPKSIGNLSALKGLYLYGNSLTGSIPESIGNLSSLQWLYLYGNQFTGSIPESIRNLLALQILDLSWTFLTGSIPNNIGNLLALKGLSLHHSLFTGSIPESIGNLLALQNLNLGSNFFTGSIPESIGNLSALQQLSLDGNRFTGSIPESIGNLLALQNIDLSSNYLTGSIPKSIGNLSALRQLYLYGNNLTGSIPEGIRNLSSLRNLMLGNNHLTGSIHESIPNLSSLRSLDLSSNGFTGSIPQSISNLSALQDLDLSFNSLTGSIPESISNLSALQDLSSTYNNLTGSIPESIGNLSALRSLYLSSNHFTGSIPESIGNLSSLEGMYLSNNSFTGSIPQSIGNLSSLQSLHLSNNSFTGSIPESIGNLSSLEELDLSANNLTGSIPKSIGNLSSLQYLDLDTNSLTGSIPESIGNLSSSLGLDFSHNELTGPIPSTLGKLSATFLDLSYNYFTSVDLTGASFGSILDASKLQNFTRQNCFRNDHNQKNSSECHGFCLANEMNTPCGGSGVGFCSHINGVAICTCNQGFIRGNGSCIRPPSPPPPSPPPPSSPPPISTRKSSLVPGVVGGSGALLACAVVVAFAFYCCSARRRHQRGYLFHKKMEALALQNHSRHQILAATANFSDDFIIGKGAYGTVYLAKAPDGTLWAVKRANSATQKTLTVFENEVHLISSVRHQNLVALLGYHCQGDEQVLVYEYVPNGTLHARIFPKSSDVQQGMVPLSFEERLEVMVGVARGLNYLHTFSVDPIVHRDVKSSNVLLDKNLQAKVADFGFSKSMRMVDDDQQVLLQSDSAAKKTLVVGTPGYMDPEYYSSFTVTVKSDVYSFGVVVLELLTGKPAVMYDPVTAETVGLARWALPFVASGRFENILDPQLAADVPLEKFRVVASVARMCIAPLGRDRPSMAQVTRYLEAAQGSTLLFDPAAGAESSLTWDPLDVAVNEILAKAPSNSSAFMRAPVSQVIVGR